MNHEFRKRVCWLLSLVLCFMCFSSFALLAADHEGFESGDFNNWNWHFCENEDPWKVISSDAHIGNYSAKASDAGYIFASCMYIIRSVEAGDTVSFYYKLDEQIYEGGLQFYAAYSTGEGSWSGPAHRFYAQTNWTKYEYTFPDNGTVLLQWSNYSDWQSGIKIDDITLSSSNIQDTIALYTPSAATFFLRKENSSGPADKSFNYGPPNWTPLVGDWDGDGTDTAGLYNKKSATFFLKNSNSPGAADLSFPFGMPDWVPITGDWDGDGKDTIGLYDRSSATFFLQNEHKGGAAAKTFAFGPAKNNWQPIAGDWDADDKDEIGLYAPASAAFYLKKNNSTGTADYSFTYGIPDWVPISGDWNGNGTDTIGLYNPNGAAFFLKNSHTGGSADKAFNYGPPGWVPLAGNWGTSSGQGTTTDFDGLPTLPAISKVTAFPNPAGGDAVTFKTVGKGIASTQVEIYNASGETVYTSGINTSNTINWDLTDNQGMGVANGVYLFTITVRGADGKQVKSEVERLLILK